MLLGEDARFVLLGEIRLVDPPVIVAASDLLASDLGKLLAKPEALVIVVAKPLVAEKPWETPLPQD